MTYKILMVKDTYGKDPFWYWSVYGSNGRHILASISVYSNKAQCRNVMKKFAKKFNIPYKEVK